MTDKQTLKIEIGHRSIIFAVLFILFLRFLGAIESILIAVFIAYLISTAIYPLVNTLHRFRIPRALSASLILLLIVAGLFAAFASVLPLVITQTSALILRLPDLISQLGAYHIDDSFLTSQISSFSGNILRIALNTFSVTVMLMTIFVISFYFIQERAQLDERLRQLFGDRSDKYKKLIVEIETKLGYWVRTMLLLMFLIGIQTYIGFELIGLEYALPLAIIAGVLEIIPNLGPTVATIPAAIVGFATSPLHGILVVGISILIQQLENNILVPNLMKNSIGLHPVVTIVALLIGFELGGALLAILSLPIVLVAKIIITHFYHQKAALA